ncbi:DUF1152 domain-containing protein [Nonomuraea terrae]|uniref:DUF1152 domain-containing protein n=1 Tax=Nonomuraea terrae TaxID=2530383 RepID=UPI00378CD263
MLESPLSARLEGSHRIPVAGAGGGFDVYAGLPLALALRERGKEAYLANLSFSHLDGLGLDAWLAEDVAAIGPDTPSRDWYFPERALARWLHSRRLPATVYAFPRVGVRPLKAAYERLTAHLGIDAIILADGGTDILMRGDEAGLGTPVEDMASLAAVRGLDVPVKAVVCLGFGVDAYHGVNHAQVLEYLAALERDGGYLGAFSLSRATAPGELYLDAVAHARGEMPSHPSIVNGSIAAAVRGEFGDVRFTDRTKGSELFVNPLMSLYFAVDLDALAARSLYLDRIEDTVLARQIASIIEDYRDEITPRPPRVFPH